MVKKEVSLVLIIIGCDRLLRKAAECTRRRAQSGTVIDLLDLSRPPGGQSDPCNQHAADQKYSANNNDFQYFLHKSPSMARKPGISRSALRRERNRKLDRVFHLLGKDLCRKINI